MRYQVAAEIRADLKRLRRETDSSGRVSSGSGRKFLAACPSALWLDAGNGARCFFGSVQVSSASSSTSVRQVAEQHKFGVALTSVILLGLVAAAAFGIYSYPFSS